MRDHVIHLADNLLRDFVEGLRGGLSGNVGGGGDQRSSEGADDLAAELVLYDADGDGAVLVDQLLRQVVGGLIDESGRPRDMREQVPCDQRDLFHVHWQPLHRVEQDDHALFLVALLDAVNPRDGLLVGGVAADTPHSISGIQNHLALFQQGNAFFNFLFHDRKI